MPVIRSWGLPPEEVVRKGGGAVIQLRSSSGKVHLSLFPSQQSNASGPCSPPSCTFNRKRTTHYCRPTGFPLLRQTSQLPLAWWHSMSLPDCRRKVTKDLGRGKRLCGRLYYFNPLPPKGGHPTNRNDITVSSLVQELEGENRDRNPNNRRRETVRSTWTIDRRPTAEPTIGGRVTGEFTATRRPRGTLTPDNRRKTNEHEQKKQLVSHRHSLCGKVKGFGKYQEVHGFPFCSRALRVSHILRARNGQPPACGGLPQPQGGRLSFSRAAILRPTLPETESPEIGRPAISSRIAAHRFSDRESAPITKFAWHKEHTFL